MAIDESTRDIIMTIHTVAKRRVTSAAAGEDMEAVPVQENMAYATVVPVKRNECYSTVLRPLTTTTRHTDTNPDSGYEFIAL